MRVTGLCESIIRNIRALSLQPTMTSTTQYTQEVMSFLQRVYEREIRNEWGVFLQQIVGDPTATESRKEWAARISRDINTQELIFKGKGMELRRETEQPLYSPIIDIAVGPLSFGARGGDEARLTRDCYNHLVTTGVVSRLLDDLIGRGALVTDGEVREWNINPRCLLAIEIENSNNNKHILGSMLNASIMAKVGILIDYEDRNMVGFLREMVNRRKSPELFGNLIYITKNNFDEIMGPVLRGLQG